jgi:hypothetical protein
MVESCGISILSILGNFHRVPLVAVWLCILTNTVQWFPFLCVLNNAYLPSFFTTAILTGVRSYTIVALRYIYLVIRWCWEVYICMLSTFVFSFENYHLLFILLFIWWNGNYCFLCIYFISYVLLILISY